MKHLHIFFNVYKTKRYTNPDPIYGSERIENFSGVLSAPLGLITFGHSFYIQNVFGVFAISIPLGSLLEILIVKLRKCFNDMKFNLSIVFVNIHHVKHHKILMTR